MTSWLPVGVISALLVAAACSSGGSADDGAGGGGGTSKGGAGGTSQTGGTAGSMTTFDPRSAPEGQRRCEQGRSVGGFIIDVQAVATKINGEVKNGIDPSVVKELVTTVGACKLYRPRQLFCAQACASGENCGEQGACIKAPKSIDVGMVSVTGLKQPTVMLPKFSDAGVTYGTPNGALDNPALDEGATITVQASGGSTKAFNLQAFGIAMLEGTPLEQDLKLGQPLTVMWKAPEKTVPSYVEIVVDLNTHGLSGARGVCQVPDNGSFTIPAAFFSELSAEGLGGFATIDITRRSSDALKVELGCVEFAVSSTQRIDLNIEGVVSCSPDDPCPDGMTCSPDLRCQ